jgi:hypothetical protein
VQTPFLQQILNQGAKIVLCLKVLVGDKVVHAAAHNIQGSCPQ